MDEHSLIESMHSIAMELRSSYEYTDQQLIRIISDDTYIPATIFAGEESPLRSLVTYLHHNEGMHLNKIAKEIHRSYRAVWGADMKEKLIVTTTDCYIPLSCFDDKKSVLEAVVTHLRKDNMRFTDIATILKKDPRTIWTVWNRAQKKR